MTEHREKYEWSLPAVAIGPIENAKTLIDIAFRKAKTAVRDEKERARQQLGWKERKAREQRQRITLALKKLQTVEKVLSSRLEEPIKAFPSFDQLPMFYILLLKCQLDYNDLRKSLGGMQWGSQRIHLLSREYGGKLRRARQEQLESILKQYYGRAASVVKQLDPALKTLENARRVWKELPRVRDVPTIVLAGAPNTGKSTLIKALTGSAPDIQPYAFTTTQLMVGMTKDGWQVIDTPGLLDREPRKRNMIEQQTIAALNHLATVVLGLIDPTEQCGYPVEAQCRLVKAVHKEIDKPMIVVQTKADLPIPEESPDIIRKQFKDIIEISAEKGSGIKELAERLRTVILKHT